MIKGIINFKYSSKYIEYLEKSKVPMIIIKDVIIYHILLLLVFVKCFIFEDIKYTNKTWQIKKSNINCITNIVSILELNPVIDKCFNI